MRKKSDLGSKRCLFTNVTKTTTSTTATTKTATATTTKAATNFQ